jgi:hypothetical protein
VAVKVTLVPIPTFSAEEVSTVVLATFDAPGATVKVKDAVAVTGVLSASAT